MNVIEFNSVWKKYKKGEKFNSLRDAVPNLFKRPTKKMTLEEKEFWAVKDVSFSIQQGEVVGIMGPNGAGKSTILKLLSRIIVPTQGDMVIRGRLSALIEVTAGFHPELTGRENVFLNGTILGMRKKEIEERFDEIVEFSGVSEFIDTPVKRYSSGMYSRLGFSVAAHMNPEILLVDEVLSVGDVGFQAKCSEKIRELLNSNATIILVSHNIPLIYNLCKRVILIDHGQMLRDGPTNEVMPYYDELLLKDKEDSLRKKLSSPDGMVKIKKEETPVEISDLTMTDEHGTPKVSFPTDGHIKVSFNYAARKPIQDPIFEIAVLRPDNILVCSAMSHKQQRIEELKGEGHVGIDLGRMNLVSGVYLIKISAWDKNRLHPLAVAQDAVLKIDGGAGIKSSAVFLPPIHWTIA